MIGHRSLPKRKEAQVASVSSCLLIHIDLISIWTWVCLFCVQMPWCEQDNKQELIKMISRKKKISSRVHPASSQEKAQPGFFVGERSLSSMGPFLLWCVLPPLDHLVMVETIDPCSPHKSPGPDNDRQAVLFGARDIMQAGALVHR